MADEETKQYVEACAPDDATVNSKCFEVHRVGITIQENVEYYSKWADNGIYDQDLCSERYQGPVIAANVLTEHFNDNITETKILDVAAGTGSVGKELQDRGFKHLDALEPAAGMLEQARKKNIYTNFYCEVLDGNRLPIDDDTYDCCVISGGMGEGQIPCHGLYELIRVTKSGGLVCIVMREEYLTSVKEYRDRLEPLMKKLEEDGKLKQLSRDVVSRYSFDNNGVVYELLVC
ncbi:methyltransferase-like protein 27 [Haliotis rubra]|uniref:methyltransferase-like protein 27 n=1 Tax=Haliotis rubra TaxID=36100 RepID=UPI001EE5A27F|nr:methyltransferase-like protein 27 [Haliotis rubra]XP_046580286.1 methyltransferase-like protein 27 [Haliotis rubra]